MWSLCLGIIGGGSGVVNTSGSGIQAGGGSGSGLNAVKASSSKLGASKVSGSCFHLNHFVSVRRHSLKMGENNFGSYLN